MLLFLDTTVGADTSSENEMEKSSRHAVAINDYPQAVVVKGKVYVGGGKASSNKAQLTVMVYDS